MSVSVLLIALAIYFLPSIVSALRWHYKFGQTFTINLFLGWTFIGWVVALVWAVGPKFERATFVRVEPRF